MPEHYLSRGDFADRIGVAKNTVSRYKLPEPDAIIGSGPRSHRGWKPETVDTWNDARPGIRGPRKVSRTPKEDEA